MANKNNNNTPTNTTNSNTAAKKMTFQPTQTNPEKLGINRFAVGEQTSPRPNPTYGGEPQR